MSTVVITGGSRGIGAAAVRAFAARGDRVFFLYEKEHEAAKAVAAETGDTTVVLAGGVSANSGLRARMDADCRKAGLRLFYPPLSLCGDNAAMVGAQGYYEFSAGHLADASLNAYATLPIEKPAFPGL